MTRIMKNYFATSIKRWDYLLMNQQTMLKSKSAALPQKPSAQNQSIV